VCAADALPAPAPCEAPYEPLAEVYDLLTAGYGHERWLGELERLARAHGLRGRRLLDVACGTGSSFLALLDAGYRVTACDLSPAMARRAAEKAGGRATVHVADARRLPRLGAFDLVTCLNDAINHLVEPDDVLRALTGMRANLARGGLLVFDVNTFRAYRSAGDVVSADDDRLVAWRGRLATISEPGALAEVVVEVFERLPGDVWRRGCHCQPHRHYPLAQVRDLVARAGLRIVATRGQRTGAILDADVDEDLHTKAIFLAARA
jgi:SAM-dependent methyltransferase